MIRAILLALALIPAAHAQTADIPRTTDGRPDFQGVWESRWRTPLERPAGLDGPTMTAEQAAKFQSDQAKKDEQEDISPPDDSEYGTYMPLAGGLFRTSQIVEPANGKLPLTDAAKAMKADWGKRLGVMAGPEDRMPNERCLGGPGRAPMPITPANMFRRIVQTPDHLVILTEDMNDFRMIAVGAKHQPAAITSYHGDSIARWEGDVLVVETVNQNLRYAQFATMPQSVRPQSRVIEHFSLTSPDEILYRFTIEDPVLYDAPWSAEYSLNREHTTAYENGCHEGNYSLPHILRAARLAEAGNH